MQQSNRPGQLRPEAVVPVDGRSEIFSEEKLHNDYKLFHPDDTAPDSKTTAEIQVALFERARAKYPIDAWEYLLARKWDEWNEEEKALVKADLTVEELVRFGHLLK